MDTFKRTIAMLVITCCLPASGYCDMSTSQPDMRTPLNAYSAFTDEYCSSIIRDLRSLASTSEVRSGEWDVMKNLLEEYDKGGIAAAAVWYALPDGGYYTVKEGSTGENLADRSSFPGLVAGSEVAGELVINRSTSKRSAVFAVPVRIGDIITGALGVSLSVDELSSILNEKMGLPPHFVFYALDSIGRVSLHMKPQLIFVYPSDLGSETLNDAVNR